MDGINSILYATSARGGPIGSIVDGDLTIDDDTNITRFFYQTATLRINDNDTPGALALNTFFNTGGDGADITLYVKTIDAEISWDAVDPDIAGGNFAGWNWPTGLQTVIEGLASGDRVIFAGSRASTVVNITGDGTAIEADGTLGDATGTATAVVNRTGDGTAVEAEGSLSDATGTRTAVVDRTGDGTAIEAEGTLSEATGTRMAVVNRTGDGTAIEIEGLLGDAEGAIEGKPDTGIVIEGVEVEAVADTITTIDSLRTSTELTFVVVEAVGVAQPMRGNEVKAYHSATQIFTGVIIEVNRIVVADGPNVYECRAEDLSRNFRRVRIAERWEETNLKTILQAIVDETTGVTLHPNQVNGPVLDVVNANHVTADQLIQGLGDLAKSIPQMNVDGEFRMVGLSEVQAPAELSDTAGIHIDDVDHDTNENEYVNIVTVLGSSIASDELVEVFAGDGTTREYSVAADINDRPTVTVNGEEQSVASVDGISAWTWSPGSNTVTQTASEALLTDADTVEIRYITLVPVLAQERNAAEVTSRGKYEKVLRLSSITQLEAIEAAKVYLRKHGDFEQRVTFRTLTSGFATGQELTVNLATPSISGTFVIDLVEYRDFGGQYLVGTITATNLEGEEDWREYFQDDPVALISGDEQIYDIPETVVETVGDITDTVAHEEASTLRFAGLGTDPFLALAYGPTGAALDESGTIDYGMELGVTPYDWSDYDSVGDDSSTTITTTVDGSGVRSLRVQRTIGTLTDHLEQR